MILELQPATDVHVDAFARVYRASIGTTFGELPQFRDDDTLRGYCTTVIAEHEAWIGVLGTEPVACLVLGTDSIQHLHVTPTSTGIGVGTRLVELAKYRRNAGLQIRVHTEALDARRFLERHGFVLDGEETDPGSGLAAVRYRWRPRP